MKGTISKWYLPFITASIVFSMFILGWSWAIHTYMPAIKSNIHNNLVPDVAYPGETVKLCRYLEITRPVDLHINRSLVRNEDGVQFAIDMGSTEVTRPEGAFMQCRFIELPRNVPPGEWELRTNVNYTDTPFWHKKIDMPVIKLTIL